MESGSEYVWTFLFRTPPLVEEGLRRLLQDASVNSRIEKRGLRLGGSALTMNPDLVISRGGRIEAVGDVKYKLTGGEWKRSDLYQAVAFAAGFRVGHAAICEVDAVGLGSLGSLQVGDVRVEHCVWPADSEIDAEEAARRCVDAFAGWLAAPTSHRESQGRQGA